MNIISFKNKDSEYGWMGNMVGYWDSSVLSIEYNGRRWYTSEHLFQCLRFTDSDIIDSISSITNAYYAKRAVKPYVDSFVILPYSKEDVMNMFLVIKLKLQQHKGLLSMFLAIDRNTYIIEDVSSRMGGSGLFWGSANVHGMWIGENILGKLFTFLLRNPDRIHVVNDVMEESFIDSLFKKIVYEV